MQWIMFCKKVQWFRRYLPKEFIMISVKVERFSLVHTMKAFGGSGVVSQLIDLD